MIYSNEKSLSVVHLPYFGDIKLIPDDPKGKRLCYIGLNMSQNGYCCTFRLAYLEILACS